jgi:hypothetical protein
MIRMHTHAALLQRCITKLEIKYYLLILDSSLSIMTFPEGGGRNCIRNRSPVFQVEGTNSIKIQSRLTKIKLLYLHFTSCFKYSYIP